MTADEWRRALAADDIARAAEANRQDCAQRGARNRRNYWGYVMEGASVLLFIAFVVFLCGVI